MMEFNAYDQALSSILSWYQVDFGLFPKYIYLSKDVYTGLSSRTLCHQKLQNRSDVYELVFVNLIVKEEDSLTFIRNAEVCPICGRHYVSYGLTTNEIIMKVDFCVCGISILAEQIDQPKQEALRTTVPSVFQNAFADGELDF